MRIFPVILALGLASPVAAQDAMQGEALFGFYCATCHGNAATGNGPMSPSLVVAPSNLTRLAAENGGVFPTARVIMRIDGRDPLVSHGSMMPVYGDFFEGTDVATKAETGQPIMTSQPIVDLLAYLQSLQQE
ncbi:cytochrome c [Loktanella sp. PT4BL]|jgi:mono/diheme cytochrome c family protein|uniref:c-type cytochrome n=1 Tax=Loktanella sp. PT4BL TaxID=2135611 RepID=UPI000D764792|nr:cytochrome c [Loktanella sp. PT4BL]PXW69110.1 cytochrome c [Loktanella sp. PT4BL]